MNDLPEDSEENATLLALQSLAYDGTAEEVAENFKNQGNDCFKEENTNIKMPLNSIPRHWKPIVGTKSLWLHVIPTVRFNLALENDGVFE
ncbi:hypothetical protein K493DRAFT_100969 [Basidiobolus meristosporus CBS 931.73]|uniref:Uncharacterized protein n=1 Tax=Basidiobolus meristosporus CBS 931.73 TaxID=1314790 RepID=A0A1Y1X051_9FUNG|nr:hypothetical protein K493DRAFT_100969 [Basidiobolus meristosporus CBS 931.73]|eukprot:ORX79170.1 hypothetical protein K493DRAFT_100969 [Basidiobolus meristosporus CBS 931.73]